LLSRSDPENVSARKKIKNMKLQESPDAERGAGVPELNGSPAPLAPSVPSDLPARHATLIQRVADHADRAAFGELFAYFAPRVKGFLMRGGVSAESADDLSQEVLLVVWRKAKLFDAGKAGAVTWIYTIARNLRIDSARRGVLSLVSDEALELEMELAPGSDVAADARQREDRVRQAIARLPEDQAKVVLLSFIQGRAHADVARDLNLPLGTVKSRLRLATEKLRGLLGALSE
jgi:RNA polymerase sigma-70 factor (ECF subfamily)